MPTTDYIDLGGGAVFWAYLSPKNNTAERIKNWKIEITSEDGSWTGVITSDNPKEMPKAKGIGGVFNVNVTIQAPGSAPIEISPKPPSTAQIGCNENCAAMVTIVADESGFGAQFVTTWCAVCQNPEDDLALNPEGHNVLTEGAYDSSANNYLDPEQHLPHEAWH